MPNTTSAYVIAAAAKEAWYDQRRSYRELRRQKCADLWSGRIESDQSELQKLWRSVDVLLGRGHLTAISAIDVESFNRFFVEKVAKMQSSTSGLPQTIFRRARSDVAFPTFSPLATDDVINAI